MGIQLTAEIDTKDKNSSLEKEILGAERLIKRDPEIGYHFTEEERQKGGISMLEYRALSDEGAVQDLLDIIKNKKYIRPENSDPENDKTRNGILEEIKAHKLEAIKLRAEILETPKVIERLNSLKDAKPKDIILLTISQDTPRNEISDLLKGLEKRLSQDLPAEEKRVLINLQAKVDNAKTAIDTGKSFNDIQVYVHNYEIKYLSGVEQLKQAMRSATIETLREIEQELEKEKARLEKKDSLQLNSFIPLLMIIENHIHNLENGSIDEDEMKNTLSMLDIFQKSIEIEQRASTSFKDKLRSLANTLARLVKSVMGVKVAESNPTDVQRKVENLALLAGNKKQDAAPIVPSATTTRWKPK